MCLYIDGVKISSKSLQLNVKNNQLYVDCCDSLFSGTGIHFLKEGNRITREAYPIGYCLFAFDLTHDLCANDCTQWNLIKHGSVRLDVRFDDPLTTTVNCIVYAEYENIM